MIFIKSVLKLDYVLSYWFSDKTKNTLIPGTAFLYLNKVSFLFTSIYFFLVPKLPFYLSLKTSVVTVVGSVALIMYGLQKSGEAATRKLDYHKEYKKLDAADIRLKRFFGILLFILCFALMFVVGAVCFSGYNKN